MVEQRKDKTKHDKRPAHDSCQGCRIPQNVAIDKFSRVNPAFWPGGAIPSEAKIFQQWIYGVLGAVLSGWAVFMAFLAQYAFTLRELWVWRCFALGIGVWFVVDSALSLYFGVVFNAFFNLLVLVALGVPLAATKKHFVR